MTYLLGIWGMGHIIDKLNNSNYSRPALVAGLVLMLFFGAFSNIQYASAANTFLKAADGQLYKFDKFTFALLNDFDDCKLDPGHWHAVDGPAGPTSETGNKDLPETMGACGYGATLPGMILCDTAGEVCRPMRGVCDIQDVCLSDGTCPDGLIQTATTPCEEGFDSCEPDSFCDGSGPSCPELVELDDGTVCDNNDGDPTECSVQETCQAGVCEGDDKPSGAICGDQSTSSCNDADTCDGNGECEENFVLADLPCGDGTDNECNGEDTCDGAGSCQDNLVALDTACGDQSSSTCDLPNACDGAGACAENFVLADLPCGDLTDDECNPLDVCDGAGVCIENFVSSGTSCGDSSDTECDNPDTCDGIGNCDENVEDPFTACGTPPTEFCEGTDVCDGGGDCVEGAELASGTECGGEPGECNDQSTCDGNGACEENFKESTAPCGDGTDNECNGEDTCDGAGSCQDNLVALDTACGNQNSEECDLPDACDGVGACNPNFVLPGVLCGDIVPVTECNPSDVCDGAGGCIVTVVTGLCNDADSCTSSDACDSSGSCVGNSDNQECLEIPPSPDNESRDLNFDCEDDNEVSITSATFTRNGVPLQPSGLSFYCPPGIIIGDLELSGIPNDFEADVIINGIEGTCSIPIGADITSISFALDESNEPECFRGQGSAAILILSPPGEMPLTTAIGGTFIPIDNMALLLAYGQHNLAWIVPLLMIVAALGFIQFRRR